MRGNCYRAVVSTWNQDYSIGMLSDRPQFHVRSRKGACGGDFGCSPNVFPRDKNIHSTTNAVTNNIRSIDIECYILNKSNLSQCTFSMASSK